ncbi:hypothetical protein PBI_SCTP2_388 [Salicola phage SCTP-2]|nr:hypothetical protein PBI_SCTP2_388 [Salicola phage SCTP-2]
MELNGLIDNKKTKKPTRFNMLKEYINDRKQKICPVVKFKFEDDD